MMIIMSNDDNDVDDHDVNDDDNDDSNNDTSKVHQYTWWC